MESGTQAYFGKELYKISYFIHNIEKVESSFHMCDHVPLMASQPMYRFMQDEYGCAHGLLIFQKHEKFCDMFVFNSYPENSMVNNFYLNKKELFTTYIQEFYEKMAHVLNNLSRYRLIVPFTPKPFTKSTGSRSTRQMECCDLIVKGLTSNEIGEMLRLSPRTVEFYIDNIKRKFGAKNRSQLVYILGGVLRGDHGHYN
jgi:DNA-binding CsgD family transcriptional regulator